MSCSTYKHVPVSLLSTELGDTLVMAEELLGTALAKLPVSYYAKLQVCFVEYSDIFCN